MKGGRSYHQEDPRRRNNVRWIYMQNFLSREEIKDDGRQEQTCNFGLLLTRVNNHLSAADGSFLPLVAPNKIVSFFAEVI